MKTPLKGEFTFFCKIEKMSPEPMSVYQGHLFCCCSVLKMTGPMVSQYASFFLLIWMFLCEVLSLKRREKKLLIAINEFQN